MQMSGSLHEAFSNRGFWPKLGRREHIDDSWTVKIIDQTWWLKWGAQKLRPAVKKSYQLHLCFVCVIQGNDPSRTEREANKQRSEGHHTHTHTHTNTHTHLLLNVSVPGCHPQGVFQVKGIQIQHASLGRHHTHNNDWDIKTGTSILKWRISWPLKKGPIGCPETLVRYFYYTLRNIAEEWISLSEHLSLSRKCELRGYIHPPRGSEGLERVVL